MTAALVWLVLAAGRPAMVFPGPADWVVTDAQGQVVERFAKLGGRAPVDVAISPDGKLLAFTAVAKAGELPRLFLWDGNSASEVSKAEGYFAAPAFSRSGRELFFVHHPGNGGGAVGQHQAGANAQLWTSALDGSASRQLTFTPGCKGRPHSTGKVLLFSHSTCSGQQGLGSIAGLTAASAAVLPPNSYSGEPRLASDGTLAFTRSHYDDTEVVVAPLKAPTRGFVVATLKGKPRAAGLQWSSDSRSLFFVSGTDLVRFDAASRTTQAVVSLTQPKGSL